MKIGSGLLRAFGFLIIAGFLVTVAAIAPVGNIPAAYIAHAQTSGPASSLKVTMIPQYPGPFTAVSVNIEDFSRDLNNVDITWTLNGKVVLRGVGVKRFNLTTGALGSVSNLSINMGGTVQQITIRPVVTDLWWQADTYTPPFYQGKALHSNQDPITIVAEPFFINTQGARLDPEKLIYKWKRNDKVEDLASGYGKKTFRFSPSILLKPTDIEVEVLSTDGTFHSVSTINIPDTKTDVVLYENHPLYGLIFQKALNDSEFLITNHEVRIMGAPFFFSRQQKGAGLLAYDWKQNGSSVNQSGNEVIFRRPEGGVAGQSNISLGVKNLERFMQASNAGLYVKFEKEADASADQGIF